jgi:hypothetical protein
MTVQHSQLKENSLQKDVQVAQKFKLTLNHVQSSRTCKKTFLKLYYVPEVSSVFNFEDDDVLLIAYIISNKISFIKVAVLSNSSH